MTVQYCTVMKNLSSFFLTPLKLDVSSRTKSGTFCHTARTMGRLNYVTFAVLRLMSMGL